MRLAGYHPSALTRLWGTALLGVAVLANLACLCRAATPPAKQVAAGEAAAHDAHACCRRADASAPQHRPAPAAPAHEGKHDDCPHCGTATFAVERVDRADLSTLHPLGFDFSPDAAPTGSLPGMADWPLSHGTAGPPASTPPTPTLLGLHCALNL